MDITSVTASPFAALTFIAAPALLTNASSVLLLGTSNRLARAVDRVRVLSSRLDRHTDTNRPYAMIELRQLRSAERRVLVILRALTAFYLAVASFSFSTMVALIGEGLITPEHAAWMPVVVRVTIGAGVVGVASVMAGSLGLVYESRLTFALLKDEADLVRSRYMHRLGKEHTSDSV